MANARRYLQLLDEVEEQAGTMDLGLLEATAEQIVCRVCGPGPDAVDLMTIHKAKGLEWDVVIVPGLERKPQAESREAAELERDRFERCGGGAYRARPNRRARGRIEGVECVAEGHRTGRERRRSGNGCSMWRVRGRGRSCICLRRPQNAKGEIVPTAGSLLATAWPAAERHFAAATAASASMAKVIVLPTAAKVDEASFVGDLAAGVEADTTRDVATAAVEL